MIVKTFATLSIILVTNPTNKSGDSVITIVPHGDGSDGMTNVTYKDKEARIVHKWHCPLSHVISYIHNVIKFSSLDQDTQSCVKAIQFSPPCMPSILFSIMDKSRIDEALRIIDDHLSFLLADPKKYWPNTTSV